MAHFAKIDSNNIVTEIVAVNNNVLLTADGTESELKGKQFLNGLLGQAEWVQTSFNASFRKNFAGLGHTYDSTRDAFVSPKPFNSWILNEDTCQWEAPVQHPIDGTVCEWDEENQEWINCIIPPNID